jgi:hypothetical protein
MTKKELLEDLKGKSFVDSLSGEPELQEVKADGGKWYTQNIREFQSDIVAVYRSIHFYVIDEGLKTEKAYYKDAIPETITRKILTFTEKIQKYITENPYTEAEKINEDGEFAVLKKYEGDVIITEKRFFATLIGGAVTLQEII